MTVPIPVPASAPLVPRSEFLGLDRPGYLYSGAHAPAMPIVEDAIVAAYRAKSAGAAGRAYMAEREQETKTALAALAGTTPSRIGLLGDASTAWSAIANGWTWKPGDNVVLNEYEHPAVFAPFLRLRPLGLEVRIVKKGDDWDLSAERILAACDERTVAIGLSSVGYVTGLRHDLAVVGRAARDAGIPFLVDVSHSLGATPLELEHAALAVSASYKWTLGPYGVGIVVWNEELLPDFRPGAVGWRSLEDIFTARRFDELNWFPDATRFQIGAPAFAEIAGLGAAARRLLEVGTEAIERHARGLVAAADRGLRELGLVVTTPADPARRAGNIAFLHPDGEAIAEHLFAAHGVRVWGGDGRIRASFHVMNDRDDVAALLAALEATLPRFARHGADSDAAHDHTDVLGRTA